MIHVHIEATSLHDLRKQLSELLGYEPRPYVKEDITAALADEPSPPYVKVDFPATLANEPSLPYLINASPNRDALQQGEWDAPEQPAEIPTNEDGTPKFRKYRPHSEPAPAPVPDAAELSAEPDVNADPAPAEPVSLPKMADCRAALNALRAKHGPAAVREILTNHGVNSFIDLKETDYPTVMKEAENYGC